jgi:hypothetical protein
MKFFTLVLNLELLATKEVTMIQDCSCLLNLKITKLLFGNNDKDKQSKPTPMCV